MLTTQTLQTINDMQVNAQSGLPVIPNNGNPAGAYNMSQNQGRAASQPAPSTTWAQRYPWMQQSPFMSTLSEQLKANGDRLRQEYMNTNVAPAVPGAQPEPAMPAQPQVLDSNKLSPLQQMLFKATGAANPAEQAAPVLPMRAGVGPTYNSVSTGPVLPNQGGLGPSNRTEFA